VIIQGISSWLGVVVRFAFRSGLVRKWVAVGRAIYFIRVRRRPFRMLEVSSGDISENAMFSNSRRLVVNQSIHPHPTAKYLLGIDLGQTGAKADRLLKPITAIQQVWQHKASLKVLDIGPRSEAEVFNVMSFGFRRENIRALDMFSFSPLIDVGDMHDMPYPDDFFDVVICGWVLSYSENKEKAAREIARVCKDGAIVGVGISYTPKTNEEIVAERGYLIGSGDRLQSTEEIMRCFGDCVGTSYFAHDVPVGKEQEHWDILSVFSISKKVSSGYGV
jgi:SAM-dependent methyltransferase